MIINIIMSIKSIPTQLTMPAIITRTSSDDLIRSGLQQLSSKDAAYWEFRRQSRRDGVHGLFQYPAMMVPRMQGDVLDVLLQAEPQMSNAWDPFLGAGTTLVESMARGLAFTGFDINPLAALLCEAKSGVFSVGKFRDKAYALISRYELDRKSCIDASFAGRDKWFTKQCSIDLSRIRRGILQEPDQWARKIMWVCFAETIRQTSNSRTSTYKLHIRPVHEIAHLPSPLGVFKREVLEAIDRFEYQEKLLQGDKLLKGGKYTRKVSIECRDIRSLPSKSLGFDLMLTSPPYGDNRSTVSYGQFSYLPLQWIPSNDLPGDQRIFETAYATDTTSLGGSAAGAAQKASVMCSVSRQFNTYYKELSKVDRPALKSKVASFIHDFFEALGVIVSHTKPDGLLVWTLGDRTVGGLEVPFVEIAKELQASLGLHHVTTVRRKIPCKRTPTRNSVSATMGTECLLVMRRKRL